LSRRSGGGGRGILSLLRALSWKQQQQRRALDSRVKNADSGIRRSTMSRPSYGSEGYRNDSWGNDDSGRENGNGSRRQKMLGYLKAANEIRQNYQATISQKMQDSYNDRGVDAPGAFPDYDMSSSGEEEMLLFPSYARRHVNRNRRDEPIQNQPLPGTEEDIERPKPPGDVEYWREEWEKYEDSNAIVDVDVRGWLYTPQRGPMNRKQRLMVALARKLSDVPPPTVSANHPVQRHVAKREEEDARREAQYLIDKGEQDADVVWRTNHAENADSDSDLPKRVTRASTDTSLGKSDVSGPNANLMQRLKPFMSNPSIESPVTVFFYNDQQSQSRTTTTNDAGHFNIRAALEFIPTHVRVLASESLSTTEEVKILEPAGVSLISDIDDTIKHSAIASGAKEVFWNTFIRDFNDLTIDGVREWYNKLADKGVGIHYVSNAPWQLYPQLKVYFKLAGLPPGSFHLKQYSGMLQGIFEPTAERKRMSLEKIMRDFPERKFILVGDSGEADLEVYTELVQQNPGKILGVFIRDVTTTEKKQFFDNSFSQKRPGYSRTASSSFNVADSIENRPPLPPRRPSSPKTIDNGDLITFDDDSPSDNGQDTPDKPAVKVRPPAKPSKPIGLRTAATMPTSQPTPVRRKPVPPLPSKPSSLSSTPNDSANETEKKPPLPRRKPAPQQQKQQQQSDTYTEAVKNLAMDVYNNIPSTKDTMDTLSNLSLTNSSTSTRQEASTLTKRGAPPPVPRARRSANSTSPSTLDERNNSPPPPPPPRPLPRQTTLSSLASSNPPTRQNSYNSINNNNSSYYDSYSDQAPSQPVLNKREELWKRRWERAEQILSDKGVILGSWRVGSDVQDITLWIVESVMKDAMKKDSLQKKSGSTGRLVDDK
jgi:phosphatidate phosphatase APP1